MSSRHLTTLAAVAVASAAAGVAVAGAAPAPAAPVIRESFTPLPCTGAPANQTTVQMLGCAEQAVLSSDKRIDSLSKSVFGHLADDPARRRFVAGANAWLAYRRADCLSVSDEFEGGSESPVLDAQCQASRNRVRIKDLSAFLKALTSG